MSTAVIHLVVEQHAEEAAFLWFLRDAAVNAPHYRLRDLVKLDERVEAHLDGLRIAGADGWQLCEDGMKSGEAGEVFAAAILALESRNWNRIEAVMAHAQQDQGTARGLVSAFGWLAPSALSGTVKNLLESVSPFDRTIGIAACVLHGVNPGGLLDALLRNPASPPELLCRALRAVGELHRRDLVQCVRQYLGSDDEEIRFWAALSAVLLGDRSASLEFLKALVESGAIHAGRALPLAIRSLDHRSAANWLQMLSQQPTHQRILVAGVGALGDPQYVPWLIQQMENPALARLSGEAFSMITGADIAYLDLEAKPLQGFEAGPSESPDDENVALDPDDNLPWPDPAKIEKWWARQAASFSSGVRYLAGAPASTIQAKTILREGYQRQRMAAALELALLEPEKPRFNVKAPGTRQQRVLGIPRFG